MDGNDPPSPTITNIEWTDFMTLLQITTVPQQITKANVKSKELPSLEHWRQFYHTYSNLLGFSIRIEHVRRDKNKNECARRWVCSREGVRRTKWLDMPNWNRNPKNITRIGCLAKLLVTFNPRSRGWAATSFETNHNHPLAAPSEVRFLRSHRIIPPVVVSQAKAMRGSGIRTISILDFIAHQYGGREKLPFQKKDLYILSQDRRTLNSETDCEGGLGYLTCLAMRDDQFFCRFNVDDENRLHSIFWADGQCRRDYALFGEVVAFDTTYRTNAYKKPLLFFVGVNHHYRTTVFGIAILADETISTFSWVLRQFKACMNTKDPKVVLIDGDHAMKAALNDQLPNTIHRLCAWHLETNAGTHVPNNDFKVGFSQLLYRFYTVDEFENKWTQLISDHHLSNDAWATSIYEKKKLG